MHTRLAADTASGPPKLPQLAARLSDSWRSEWLLSQPQAGPLDDYLKFNCSPLGVINMYAIRRQQQQQQQPQKLQLQLQKQKYLKPKLRAKIHPIRREDLKKCTALKIIDTLSIDGYWDAGWPRRERLRARPKSEIHQRQESRQGREDAKKSSKTESVVWRLKLLRSGDHTRSSALGNGRRQHRQ